MSCRSHTPRNRPSNNSSTNTRFSWSEYRRTRTGDEDTYSDCNELGKDLITCHRKACLLLVVFPTVFLVFVLVITGAVLGGVFGATSIPSGSSSRPRDPSILTLSPGFTRNVSFGNAFFCNEVTLEANGSRGTGASVYLITATPPLTHRNSFISTFSLYLHAGTHRTWPKYRLYSGINVTISLYIPRPPSNGVFSVFKGLSNLSSDQPFTSFSIRCTSIGYTRQISFQSQDEDDYYFVYRSESTPCSLPFFQSPLNYSISASWFVHSTSGLTTAPNCSATTSRQCSLHVPADSNYRALIVTDLPTNNPDLSENISIRLQCSSTRGWAYAVVVLLPLLLVVGVTITTVILLVVCCCCCWRKRRASHQSHNTQTTTTEEAATTSGVRLQRIEHNTAQQPVTDQKDNKTTSDSQKVKQQHHVLTAAPPPSYNDSLDYPAQKTVLPPPYYSKE